MIVGETEVIRIPKRVDRLTLIAENLMNFIEYVDDEERAIASGKLATTRNVIQDKMVLGSGLCLASASLNNLYEALRITL